MINKEISGASLACYNATRSAVSSQSHVVAAITNPRESTSHEGLGWGVNSLARVSPEISPESAHIIASASARECYAVGG